MKSGIYKIVNLVNNKIYVGSAKNIKQRWGVHLNDFKKGVNSQYLQRSWNKHGEDNFKFEVIEYCPLNALLEREQYWMDFYDVCNTDKGFNIALIAGSSSGVKRSAESIEKMRKSKKEWYKDPVNRYSTGKFWRESSPERLEEAKQKLRQANLGKKHTEESKSKCSLSRKGKTPIKVLNRTLEEKRVIGETISKAKKGVILNIDPIKKQEAQQKAWETRRKNGTDKGYKMKSSKEILINRVKKMWEGMSEETKLQRSLKIREALLGKHSKGNGGACKGKIYGKRSEEVGRLISLVKKYNNRQKKTVEFFKNNNMSELLNIVNY